MTRYFYRCPIRATLMREHGINYTNPPPEWPHPGSKDAYRVYIHPDSEYLLQPMVGDVISWKDSEGLTLYTTLAKDLSFWGMELARMDKIIMRNNLPFISPEVEG